MLSTWCSTAVQAQPAKGDFGASSPVVWRAFNPWVVACGDGDADRAVTYLNAGSAVVRKADTQLERDKTTELFRTRAIELMEDFDLKGFYELLPHQADNARSFSCKGAAAANSYKVTATREKGFEVDATSARRALGDSSLVLRMRKVPRDDERRYILEVKSGVGVGQLTWPSVLAGVRDGLRLFQAYEGVELPLVMKAADKFLLKARSELSERERRVLSGFWGSYPQLSDLLLPISRGSDLIDEQKSKDGVVRVNAVSRWNIEALARSYPKLAEYFKELGDVAAIKLRVVDGRGDTLVEAEGDTKRMQSRVSVYLRDGKLVPVRKGQPQSSLDPQYEKMRVHVDLHFVLHRIDLYIDDLRIDLSYRENTQGAELVAKANQLPKVRVEGAAFGLVPAGMVDWFIPGDLAGLTKRMLSIAISGNEGRGFYTQSRFHAPPGKLATYDAKLEVELLDSALVRFGMKVVSDRAIPDEDQEEDIRKFYVAIRDAWEADLARFAKFGAVVLKGQGGGK